MARIRQLGSGKNWWKVLHRHAIFIWIFIALVPTSLLVFAVRSDGSLHVIEAKMSEPGLREPTPTKPVDLFGTTADTRDVREVRVITITPISPTEIRIVGADAPPDRQVFAALRSPNSDSRLIKAEAIHEETGSWSANVRLNNAGCRAHGNEMPPVHLTFLLSLVAPSHAVEVNDREPITGSPETEWHLPC